MENMEKFVEKFKELYAIDLSQYVEKKPVGKGENQKELTYLSWTYAVKTMTEQYPDWDYEVMMFDSYTGQKVPYMYDENVGYMVMTKVTANGKTKMMWLPVMDGANNAMKSKGYEIKYKSWTASVNPASMTDINKTIMRCLVKNIAMFGIGLYIYAGEDIPNAEDEGTVANNKATTNNASAKSNAKQVGKNVNEKIKDETKTAINEAFKKLTATDDQIKKSISAYKVKSLDEFTELQAQNLLGYLKDAIEKREVESANANNG